jgi:hypothetical protein
MEKDLVFGGVLCFEGHEEVDSLVRFVMSPLGNMTIEAKVPRERKRLVEYWLNTLMFILFV